MGRKVFVVDDESQIADVVSVALAEAGFEVETFYHARLALLRVQESPPDILVSDVVMPEVDGFVLAQEARGQNPSCKVILMSGNPEWKSRERFHGDGSDGFALLFKPFSLSQLLQLVKSELS